MGKQRKRWYREVFLKSPEWKEFRAEYLWKHQKCARCDRDSTTVHHVRYPPNIWDLDQADMAPLCDRCHGMVERGVKCGMIPKPGKTRPGMALEKAQAITRSIQDSEILKVSRKKPIKDRQTHARVLRKRYRDKILNGPTELQEIVKTSLGLTDIHALETLILEPVRIKYLQQIVLKWEKEHPSPLQKRRRRLRRKP